MRYRIKTYYLYRELITSVQILTQYKFDLKHRVKNLIKIYIDFKILELETNILFFYNAALKSLSTIEQKHL